MSRSQERPRPPDAARTRERSSAPPALSIVTILVGLVSGVAVMALAPYLSPPPPLPTPSPPKVQAIGPTPDLRLAAAVDAVSRNTAALPTIAALLAATPTPTAAEATETPVTVCGKYAIAGKPCEWPLATALPTVPPPACVTPEAGVDCIWQGR